MYQIYLTEDSLFSLDFWLKRVEIFWRMLAWKINGVSRYAKCYLYDKNMDKIAEDPCDKLYLANHESVVKNRIQLIRFVIRYFRLLDLPESVLNKLTRRPGSDD